MTDSKLLAFDGSLKILREKWTALQDPGVCYDFPIPDLTLDDCFRRWVELQPSRIYVYDQDGSEYTYELTNTMACQLAGGLKSLGAEKGDRIILYLKNGIDFVVAVHACFKLGLIVVNANPLDAPKEMIYKINDSGARIGFYDDSSREALDAALSSGQCELDYLIDCDNRCESRLHAGVVNEVFWQAQLIQHRSFGDPITILSPDETIVLQYTGGTTGISKGCRVTHRNYLAKAMGAAEFYKPAIGDSEWRIVLSIPLSHAYGFTQVITGHLVTGGSMILLKCKPSLEDMLAAIQKYRPTVWPVVPVILNTLADRTDLIEKYDLSSLKSIVCGASPLYPSTIEAVEAATGAKITEGYGLTEVVSTVTGVPFGIHKPGSVGIPFPNIDVLVVDKETGEHPLPLGDHGEMIVRSIQNTPGYWNKPEETAATIRDGWLYTGDIGYFDERGLLYVGGRIKDLIIVSGFNVYPMEIDEEIQALPDVVEVCTIGVPDKMRGEVPKSYIVLKQGSTLTFDEIRDYLQDKLVRYKIPHQCEFVDEIPKTKNNKPDKTKLRAMHDARLEQGRS